ncbi:type II toxin-antitoxin system RelE/ParE family toxin [Candidatus Woesearchaeota archaeon]|nr:type II toxin-antitoxin system RelE/ParE family toxin [Candidatus Woesearchaeota archaeon]
MVDAIFDLQFRKEFEKIKNKDLKEKIIKQVSKIKNNPEIGKPMRYSRKGTRELYMGSSRLSYIIEGILFTYWHFTIKMNNSFLSLLLSRTTGQRPDGMNEVHDGLPSGGS